MALIRTYIVLCMYVCMCSAITTLQAVYNIGGVTGKITFSQQMPGGDVAINLDLEGINNGYYTLELHEYRVNYDVVDRCSDNNIGSVIGTASATSGKGHLVASGMDLSGTKSIEGRSFVISDNNWIKACATIESDADYITAVANMPANIGGRVIFRQQDNSESADTLIYLDLYRVGANFPQAPLKWQINSGIVKMDTTANTDISNRCGSTIKELYNPDSSTGDGCSHDDHVNCKVGDLSAKHGDITIQQSDRTKAFFGDLKLPLSGENSIIGKTLVFLNGTNYYACANIVEYPHKAASAKFSHDKVTGSVTFEQKSPLDPILIQVKLQNIREMASGYHVHEWPVPQQTFQSETMCDATHVGGHFNPFSVSVGSLYPLPASTTPEKYEVGDISGKFGTLASKNSFEMNFTDPNLQLFGMNSIVGRSIVIHKAENGARWMCSTINYADEVPIETAYARFTYPVIGYMVFRQPRDKWFAETQIYVELDYASMYTSQTIDHNWHVHVKSIDNDMLAQTGRCQSVGGHYNPYAVDLMSDYSTACKPENIFRCEQGDLSGKHGKIRIRTKTNGKQKYFFTDIQLPLSGPQSIVGRSITIHDANSGAGRLACANIKQRFVRKARVSKWSSAEGQGSPTGTISFTQNAINILTGDTEISVLLSGLKSEVSGYHIHRYPTSVATPQAQVCQSSDVGGHFNPFGGPSKGPAVGTLDEYEVGDLSGKFNPLSGTAYSSEQVDWTLPMAGPFSIIGRSIVIHKNDAAATRWACGNIEEVMSDSKLVIHKAVFIGDVAGYILLSQLVYPNKDTSNTMIEVNLHYANNTKMMTTGHNWHVHVNRKTGNCQSCGSHYNPYMVNMDASYSECGISNPLRCELGDQSSKLGTYDIGGGKRFYTDVNLNLEGLFSASKRSIVIHGPNKAGVRIACANLIPYGQTAEVSDLDFPTVNYTISDIELKVASFIGTDVDNILVVENSRTVACTNVKVYFLDVNKKALRTQFEDNMRSKNHNNLGQYAPVGECRITGGSEFPVVGKASGGTGTVMMSTLTILLCLLISKERMFI